MMAASTAYTAVSPRRTLSRPEQSVSFHSSLTIKPDPNLNMFQQSSPPPPKQKAEWPPAVREYVQRCFAPESQIPGIDSQMIEAKLKEVITKAAEGNTLLDVDWANLPLPQQLIQQERSLTQSFDLQMPGDWESPAENTDNAFSKKRKLTPNFTDNHSKKKATPPTKKESSSSPPPWHKLKRDEDSGGNFGDRISFANTKQGSKQEKRLRKQQEALGKGSSKFQAAAEKRKQRFGAQLDDSPPWSSPHHSSSEGTAPTGPVIGTSQKLEKNYFRLTSPPKPDEVRPQDVLEKTFALLKKKWSAETNYVYICDQFKSMRQDLLVQHIKNKFTVSVYELHARIALEKKDLGEYNQCQTQLRALYAMGIEGDRVEFMAYRILYFVHTCNRIGMNDVLADITPEDRLQPPIQHALAVRSAQASGNYHKLLAKLYQGVPNMGAYLMDLFVDRERIAALAVICRSYKPTVSHEFIAEELGFDSYTEAIEFLIKHGAADNGALDTNTYRLDTGKAAPLFVNLRASAFRTVDIKGQI
ncbi:hypothetical protein BLS_004767 [Venturia inaequalis]|uniref:SAC3/GANP/THP3 conserved domain-containing protein n=1 Tax=Venturia inaequalis TaxID=5025 RepID=A0A8H3UK38_VENIN|nr:hypothetical protein BLS_004767 [Venturia inaequalis]KAE9973622.1 hypothetical protein EG328_004293 [Venturia inaequalis]KAE9981932.1 hypothetical protein EG327_006046 [Venturia inaequalis]